MITHLCELYIKTWRKRHTAMVYAECSCGWIGNLHSKVPMAEQEKTEHLRQALSQSRQTEHP